MQPISLARCAPRKLSAPSKPVCGMKNCEPRSKPRDRRLRSVTIGSTQPMSSPKIGSSCLQRNAGGSPAGPTSIITVYYNTPEDLLRLAESIHTYLPQGSFEWIIADNASRENMSSQIPWATYLRMSENYGFARACNLAAEQGSAPLLFFLNPDCLLKNDS